MTKNGFTLRLEQALRHWEDQMLLRNVANLFAKSRPELAWSKQALEAFKENVFYTSEEIRSARGQLLHATKEDLSRFDLFTKALHQNDLTLWCLYGWCKHSRRIYHMPVDLQLMLQATRVGDHILDVAFPFVSFAIHLEEAIEIEDEVIDTIIVFRECWEDGYRLTFTLLPTWVGEKTPLHQIEKREIEEAVKRKDMRKIERIAEARLDGRSTRFIRTFKIGTVDGVVIRGGSELIEPNVHRTIDQHERDFAQKGMPAKAYGLVMRLVFGLAHYLTMIGQEAEHAGWSKGPRQQGPLRVITDEALVCTVQCSQILTDEERGIFRNPGKGGGLEISPHFREGYWSRPPGQGDDPTASKTVWHRPTIVRKDRLPDGALPYGVAKNATR